MISVIIPTANRPNFLRTALNSIQRQTALNKISEVIVSENGGTKASEHVCRDFGSLPINYVYRDPQTTIVEHFSTLIQETRNEFSAVLFDDDWWAANHIENGLKHFAAGSDLTCYFSAYFMVQGEASELQCHPTTEFWAGSGFRSFEEPWRLTLKDTAVACLVDVPCTYSSIITPIKYLKKAWLEVIKSGNKYDNDRTLTLELAQQGPIIVNPVPETFVRFHPGQDKNRSSPDQVMAFKRSSLMHLVDVCHRHQIDLGAELDARLLNASSTQRRTVCNAILANYDSVISENIVDSKVLLNFFEANHQQIISSKKWRVIKHIAKQILPPIILESTRRFRQKTLN